MHEIAEPMDRGHGNSHSSSRVVSRPIIRYRFPRASRMPAIIDFARSAITDVDRATSGMGLFAAFFEPLRLEMPPLSQLH